MKRSQDLNPRQVHDDDVDDDDGDGGGGGDNVIF
jgi:hypothetical protein